VGAAILAPPVAAEAWWRHAGSGLSAGALRVSARQLLGLPLPADRAAWRRGAALLARWQRTPSAATARAFAETMCRAHGVTGADARAVGGWWLRAARLDAR
jgi:hypothetical protein